jgi:hypothetical protein
MTTEGMLLESRIHEYENLLKVMRDERQTDQDDSISITQALCRNADWTVSGAQEIVELVKNYGTFILRNALAVAVVLGMEDGNKGF